MLGSGLRGLDPVVSTAVVTSVHALMIYDLLLAQDAGGKIRPQMASWHASPDGKAYTFVLRDGLKWHDGAPVTADDCVASIKRWAQVDPMGQIVMSAATSIRTLNEKSFVIAQPEANDLVLEALAKTSAIPAFMMPKRVAETPPHQSITDYTGSGPFKFVTSEFQPGVKAVYEKNRDYVPRRELASGSAGGKVVNVDRVQWITMPDQATALNALLSGEIDFLESI
ncbi:MAG: ABC transporter substrate-binding protein, partial [Vulcanimicrobiaceae bacterium]